MKNSLYEVSSEADPVRQDVTLWRAYEGWKKAVTRRFNERRSDLISTKDLESNEENATNNLISWFALFTRLIGSS